MTLVNQKKRKFFSFISLLVFLAAQPLPVLAQGVPPAGGGSHFTPGTWASHHHEFSGQQHCETLMHCGRNQSAYTNPINNTGGATTTTTVPANSPPASPVNVHVTNTGHYAASLQSHPHYEFHNQHSYWHGNIALNRSWGNRASSGLPWQGNFSSNTPAINSARPYWGTTRSVNLDLSSTIANMTAGYIVRNGPLNINVGNSSLSVNSHTQLTPAEYLAALQIARTGQQNLLLDSAGSASGGTAVINSRLSHMLNNLVIPTGVSIIDFSHSGTLNLAGNINNSGNLYVSTRNPLVENITVGANNILNSGNLSNIIPSNLLSSNLSWLNSNTNSILPNPNLGLTLNALNSITNTGTMSSAGNLNLNPGSGNLINTGLMASTNGNINISTPNPNTNINIQAPYGTFQALNGAINVRDHLYTGAAGINMNGGDYLSKSLNLYSGTGEIFGSVGQVTGVKTGYAGIEHFYADTPNLVLGNTCITGDPTYANTGDITINGTFTLTEALAVIAGGNIIGSVSSNITGNSPVTLVAGAHITSGGGTGGQTITNATGGVGAPVTFTFDNTAGGNIDFTASTSNPVINATGAAVTLLANSNSATTGNVWFATTGTSILTSNNAGSGGSILIVAGGQGGTAQSGAIASAIQTGALSAQSTGQGGSGGSVTVYAAAPVITGNSATYNTTGQLTSGSYPTSAGSYTFNNNGAISINANITTSGGAGINGGAGVAGGSAGNGGNVTIQGGSISMISATTTGGTGGTGGGNGGGAGGNGGNSGNTGNVSVIANGAVSLGAITANGPTGGAAGAGALGQGAQGGTPGNPGSVTITSTTSSISASGTISASGATGGLSRQGGTGGNGGNGVNGSNGATININAATTATFNGNITASGGAGSAGGAIGSGGTLSGAGGNGGLGGTINVTAGNSITLTAGNVNALGGTGQSAGTNSTIVQTTATGGNGGVGGTVTLQTTNTGGSISIASSVITTGGGGGVGRSSSVGGNGANGGTINVTSDSVSVGVNITNNGGFAGAGGSIASGNGAAGGNSGSGGNITVNAVTSISVNNQITSNAGDAGFGGGTSGANTAGAGGTSGNGGVIQLTASGTSSTISVTNVVNANAGTAGSGSTGRGGNGAQGGLGGIIQLTATTVTTGNLAATGGNGGGGSDASTTGGNGGNGANGGFGGTITVTSSTQSLGVLTTAGGIGGNGGAASGAGNTAGNGGTGGAGNTIDLISTASGTIASGGINASGSAGGNAGTASSGASSGTAGNGGAGGSIGLTAGTYQINNSVLADGGSPGSGGGSPVWGNGGAVTLITGNVNPILFIGTNAGNYIDGSISASGNNGGTVNIATGGTSIEMDGNIFATNQVSGSGTGGIIYISNTVSGQDLNVENNGTMQVSNNVNTGNIGFNNGSTGVISITGGGTLTAGDTVNVGDVPTAATINSPFTVVSPFTGTYTNQGGNITITQAGITGTLQVSNNSSPTPTPTPSGGGGSTTTISTGLTPQERLFLELKLLALLEQFQLQNAQKLAVQIGTRIPTHYTPWTTYPQRPQIALQGIVAADHLQSSITGQAQFTASEFNATELMALSHDGILFGPNSGNNFLSLEKGYVLFRPTQDIEVQTHEGRVLIAKGSSALVVETGNDAAVYDFHDRAGKPIKVIVNGKEFVLAPGKELLLTRNINEDFAKLNPDNALGYRDVRTSDAGAGIKAYICDFSITHGMFSQRILYDLLTSNDPAQKKAAREMIKNAAIIANLKDYPEYKTGH